MQPTAEGAMEGDGRPEDEDVEARSPVEVLAALCTAGALAALLSGILQALAIRQATADGGEGPSGWQLVELAAGEGSFLPGLGTRGTTGLALLVLAFVLVVVVRSGPAGGLGAWVLQGLVAVGALMALAGVIGAVAVLRQPGNIELLGSGPLGEPTDDVLLSVTDRLARALPVAAGAAVAGYVAWSAYRAMLPAALAELDAEAAEAHEELGDG